MPYQTIWPLQRSWPLPTWPWAKSASLFTVQGRLQASCLPQQGRSLLSPQSVVVGLQLVKAWGFKSQGSFWTSLNEYLLSPFFFSLLLHCPLIPARHYQVAVITDLLSSHAQGPTSVQWQMFTAWFSHSVLVNWTNLKHNSHVMLSLT